MVRLALYPVSLVSDELVVFLDTHLHIVGQAACLKPVRPLMMEKAKVKKNVLLLSLVAI